MIRRPAQTTYTAHPVIEGAGVHLRRVFGFGNEHAVDPFLMLDDFRSDKPDAYMAGFPWHPHRGIETITYVLEGDVEHGDSLGNAGTIGAGDVQWMTAGSGIIHQEMPVGDQQGRLQGFQLWANLPADQKMMDPRYRGLTDCDIPEVHTEDGACVRVICGEVEGTRGPVEGVVTDPEYLDISLPPRTHFTHEIDADHTALAYVIEGAGEFAPEAPAVNRTAILYGDGDGIEVTTAEAPVRFLLLSGRPLGESIAWRGPIVMNTQDELRTAFQEYREGTFVKVGE